MHALVHATMRSDPRYEFEGKTHAIGGVHCVSEVLNKLELPTFRRDVVRGSSSRRNSIRSLYLNSKSALTLYPFRVVLSALKT